MQSFKSFLAENINSIEKSLGEDEVFLHVNNDGDLVVEDTVPGGEEIDADDFDTFYSDDEDSTQE